MAISLLLAGALTGGAALADARLEGPMDLKKESTFVIASGTLLGLGNDAPATATLTVTGTATITCVNSGGTQPAGVLKPSSTMPVNQTTTKTFAVKEIEKKGVKFSLTSSPPTPPEPKAAGCPDENWKVEVSKVEFKNVTLTVEQGGRIVLNESSPM
jgi:hypothetical protein